MFKFIYFSLNILILNNYFLNIYLKQFIAVTLLTTDAKNATAVVKDVTNIDGTACFIVSCTSLTNPLFDIFCSLPLSQILQYINASSAPIP